MPKFYCKFCQSGGELKEYHTEACARDLPNAEQYYLEGWMVGHRDLPSTSENPAYKAGYRDGTIAHEGAVN